MHDINKSLNDAARSIDRAAKGVAASVDTEPTATYDKPEFGYEQMARERAERELYAAKYRETVMAEQRADEFFADVVEPSVIAEQTEAPVPESEPIPAEPQVAPEEQTPQNDSDPQPRVTENGPDGVENTSATEARVLTIPGAVYRIYADRSAAATASDSTVASTVTAVAPTVFEPSPIYAAAVADEVADDIAVYDPMPTYEPESKTAHPATADAAEDDVDSLGIDYATAANADDAGTYTVEQEYIEGEPVSDETHPIAIPYDPTHEEEEYARFLAEHEQSGKRAGRRTDLDRELDPCYFPVDAIDKCIQLVKLRTNHEIEQLKSELKMLSYTFSMDVLKKDRMERKIRRGISDRMAKLSRAVKRERLDCTRYYTAAHDKYVGNAEKRSTKTAEIESVLARLEYALKEREQIEDKLMQIYTESIPGAENIKETKAVERAARNAYKAHAKVAKRVARMRIDNELKEKIFALMNERVTLLSTIARNEYNLSKKRYTGAEKRDVKQQNRAMKRSARKKAEDVRIFVEKAEKQNGRRGSRSHQVAWLVGALVAIALIVVVFFLIK